MDQVEPVGRRRELLDAADRVVMREGPRASMNAIAAEAGVTKPILYRHFRDKGGLYQALADRHIEDLLTDLRAALRTRGGLRARTEATIDAYLSVIEGRPQVYRFLMDRASIEDPDVRGQLNRFLRRLADELADGIRTELSLGRDPGQLAVAWAHAIVGMVQGAGDWWLDERRVSREQLVRQLSDLLWGDFARRGGAPR
ncbi:MAG: TetR family transcriptional regulator [Carbonactinosporaceae bacterium]